MVGLRPPRISDRLTDLGIFESSQSDDVLPRLIPLNPLEAFKVKNGAHFGCDTLAITLNAIDFLSYTCLSGNDLPKNNAPR